MIDPGRLPAASNIWANCRARRGTNVARGQRFRQRIAAMILSALADGGIRRTIAEVGSASAFDTAVRAGLKRMSSTHEGRRNRRGYVAEGCDRAGWCVRNFPQLGGPLNGDELLIVYAMIHVELPLRASLSHRQWKDAKTVKALRAEEQPIIQPIRPYRVMENCHCRLPNNAPWFLNQLEPGKHFYK